MAEELEELDYYKGRRWGWNDGPNASRATLIGTVRMKIFFLCESQFIWD